MEELTPDRTGCLNIHVPPPPNSYVEILTLNVSEGAVFGR